MARVQREEILGLEDYAAARDALRAEVMGVKEARRVHLGEHLTFLFENADTIRYQIQEMLRIEQITAEDEVRHELDTYNELLGDPGELGCTLLIEIDDPLQRDLVLRRWLDLPKHLYLRLANGEQARAIFDPRQVGETRLSSVQYLKFRCGDSPPTALGVDLPGMELEQELRAEQRAALAADLDDSRRVG